MQERQKMNPAGERGSSLVGRAVGAGLAAGAVFLIAEVLVAIAMGMPAGMPIRMFASILLGQEVLQEPLTFGALLLGLIVHFALSAAFGAVWAAMVAWMPAALRIGAVPHTLAAIAYGFLLWFVNFQIIARVLFPWFLGTNSIAQILLHMFAFGLPLGFFLTIQLKSPERVRVMRRRTV